LAISSEYADGACASVVAVVISARNILNMLRYIYVYWDKNFPKKEKIEMLFDSSL
jgi:hypothetical protein